MNAPLCFPNVIVALRHIVYVSVTPIKVMIQNPPSMQLPNRTLGYLPILFTRKIAPAGFGCNGGALRGHS